MIQIPVLSITESDGVFTFQGPHGMGQVMSAEAIEEEVAATLANVDMALRIARANWWLGRKNAADKTAHDAANCRVIQWEPEQEEAVSYQ